MSRVNSNILGTSEISYELEKLVDESYKFLVIVSPYLKITDRIKGKLLDCFNKTDKCFFVFRANELRPEEQRWIESFKNVHLISVKNLHAKIYVNENRCLITSMNLYEYSQINNHEIGVEIDRVQERKDYLKVLDNIVSIVKMDDVENLLQQTLDPYRDFTVGNLFNKLRTISRKYNSSYSSTDMYIKFCNDVRKLMNFGSNDLYQDKSAILRHTHIGKEKYDFLLRELK